MEYNNVINARYIELCKAPVIVSMIKIELIDESEQNTLAEISDYLSADNGGSIGINYQQGVRRSIEISIINTDNALAPSAKTGLFWIGTKFKVHIGIKDYDRNDIYWFSQGVFYVNNPSNSRQSGGVLNISGVDKFGILGNDLGYNQLTGAYLFKSGQKIYSIIRDILMLDKGNGFVIDPIEPVLDPLFKDEVLPYDINKGQGEYLGDILIELANILGANIFYDINGRLNIKSGTLDMSYAQESPIWEFSDIELEYSNSSLNYAFSEVVNVITVVGNNINDKVYTYTAENNNPNSPTRIEYVGRKEIPPIETAMAYNDERAKDYAKFVLSRKSKLQLSMDFGSSLIPHLDVDSVCTITDGFFNYNKERFIIQSINMPFSSHEQIKIGVCNTSSLPYYDLLEGGGT
ncbi:MAG: hypothetical protein RR198_06995 [Oscillospiraceae bacterium]